MGTLVRDHGLDYLFAATILTGIIQLIFGVLKIARFMKFIPRSVMVGFVNALAILIFMAQVPHFVGVSNMTYVVAGITLLIIYVLPRFTKAVPSALVAIIAMTVFAIFGHFDLRTVGDLGEMKQSLPAFMIPNIPFNFETLAIIFPTAFALSIVGLLESLLTSSIVDDMTDTESDKTGKAADRASPTLSPVFRRHGGMRDDRPVCDQCKIRRKRPLVHLCCRCLLNVFNHGAGRLGRTNSDGSFGWRDDYGIDRDV